MEIISDKSSRKSKKISFNRARNTYIGSVLILASIIWLLRNFDILPPDIFDAIFSWPMLVILIGGYLLAMRQYVTGGIVTFVGLLLFLIRTFHFHFPMDKIFVPLLLFCTGIAFLVSIRNKE
ncbi:MAG TPA: hypothetical protein IAA13_08235 [Candidatus Alistipes merdigallinarum]|nr:hypothetical protein [Candidatus Alistipes merdigallinarum]